MSKIKNTRYRFKLYEENRIMKPIYTLKMYASVKLGFYRRLK